MNRALTTIAAAVVILTGAALVSNATPLSAEGATLGPGYEYHGQAGSHLGGYSDPDGTVSYCINAGAPSAIGKVTTDAGIVGSVNNLDPATMVRLNEVLSAHGNTSDDNTAAAVAMAVWSIAGAGDYEAEGGDRYVLGRAPAGQRATIQAMADQFRAEANAYAAPTGSSTLTLAIDPTNTALGTLTVTANGTGNVALTNARFGDTGLTTRDGVGDGTPLQIIGAPPGAEPYRVSAKADFVGASAPEPTVHVYTTPGSQTLTASGTSSPITFTAQTSDTADRVVLVVTTSAQATATVGGTITDVATATGVPPAGETLTWSAYLQQADSTTALCDASTLVFTSTTPLTITADGEYSSESFAVTEADVGRILWVETAVVNGVTVATGNCGEASEVTVVVPATHLPVVSG